jgi:hypothetical protein
MQESSRPSTKLSRTASSFAIKGRLVAIVLLVLWLLWSRGRGPAAEIVMVGGIFAALGLLQFSVIATRWDRSWSKYVFLALDVAILSTLVALAPVEPRVDLPQAFIFRFNISHYYFLFVAIAGLSLSPGLLLWAGVVGSIGWLGAYLHVYDVTENPLLWGDIPLQTTRDEFLGVSLSPNFLPAGSRFHEIVILLITAILLAVVIKRANQLKTPYRDGTSHVVFEPMDFLAKLAALVPKSRINLTRFHGVFAANSRFRSEVTPGRRGRQSDPLEKTPTERRRAMSWAKRLKRVFNIDVEVCSHCGGRVKVLAGIEEQSVIDQILNHLDRKGTWFTPMSLIPEGTGPPAAQPF